MRTFVPQTSFVSSPGTEKERLLYTCESIASGFFYRHGFIVVPKAIKEYKSYCVVVPETVKQFSRNFWHDAFHYGAGMPKIITPAMKYETASINLKPVSQEKLKHFEKEWEKIENEVWVSIHSFFPAEIKWIGSLEVRITSIGTHGSHHLLDKRKGQKLILNLREDAKAQDVISLLILSLIYPYEKELGLSFTHRQTVRNFLMSRRQFKNLYPEFLPKTFDNPKIPASIKAGSNEYVRLLHIPRVVDPIPIIKKNISIFGNKEEKLILNLISSNEETLTYDRIADIIWGSGKFKSYWAINKMVQRLQLKVNSLGIDNFKIKGVRGRGYRI